MTADARLADRRPRVMVVVRGFPNGSTAGDLSYLDALIRLFEGERVELRVVVLGDRFPDNEFVYTEDVSGRLERVSFPHGVRIGRRMALKGLKPIVKNAARRTVLAMPAGVTRAATSWYFTRQRASVLNWFSPVNPRELRFALSKVADFHPDHLLIDSIRLSDIVEHAERDPARQTHVLMYDLFGARLESFRQFADTMPAHEAAALADVESRLPEIAAEELRRLALFDCVVAIQRKEADYVAERLARQRVMYLPMPAFPTGRIPVDTPLRHTCLFVGSRGDANVHGIRWFLDKVWPLVRERVPDASASVCGTCCAYLHAPDDSVRLQGRVAGLGSYYERADVCVVPLLAGSGMKIKMVDALSRGAACVATAVGMQGLEGGAGSAFLHADGPEAFAAAVVQLMQDKPLRDRLRQRAAAFVEAQLAPDVAFRELRDAICGSRAGSWRVMAER